jgi:hypothetical protein
MEAGLHTIQSYCYQIQPDLITLILQVESIHLLLQILNANVIKSVFTFLFLGTLI